MIMNIRKLRTDEHGVLFQLDRELTWSHECISHDDIEVNANNASDVIESCKEIPYSYILKVTQDSSFFDHFYIVDAEGKKLLKQPIVSSSGMTTEEIFRRLYGEDVTLEKVSDPRDTDPGYDNFYPDHQI